MGIYQFLASLPAILGLAGAVTYFWVGHARIGGEMLKGIVQRLRTHPNIDVAQYGALTPAKLKALLATDKHLRGAVNEGDTKLLLWLIILQYMLITLILLVCTAMVGSSVWLYIRPEPFSVTQSGVKAVIPEAQGVLVDLDPLQVDWTFRGTDQMVSVFLENVDTGDRTQKKSLLASARSTQFSPTDLIPLLRNRDYGSKNRVRSVIEWNSGNATSDPQDLAVGIDVELMLYGRLLTPDGKTRDINTLFATIDGSTQNMPHDYRFRGDFVGRNSSGQPVIVPLESDNLDGEVTIPNLDQIDWTSPCKFLYDGPDRLEIVRTNVTGKGPFVSKGTATRAMLTK